jgi:hypothetical protein
MEKNLGRSADSLHDVWTRLRNSFVRLSFTAIAYPFDIFNEAGSHQAVITYPNCAFS